MSESDGSDYEEAVDILTGKPTADDVDRLRAQLNERCLAVSAYLLSSREPVDKRRLIESTINDLFSAFNRMASTYLSITTASQVACSIKAALKKSVREEVSAAIKDSLSTRVSASAGPSSYASVASMKPSGVTRKIKITNGPTVTVPSSVSVVIGPKAANDSQFATSDETRKAIVAAVKPCDVDLRVNKVVNTRNKSVRIIAESLDLPKLRTSPALAAAGLEVKEREKLNPRLVVRDVPVDCSSEALVADITSLNLMDHPSHSVKVIYRYPSRHKNGLASVVIETTAEVRRMLLEQGRVFLPWHSCKVEDHLRILQCFRCQSFGHLAKSCTSATVCGKCAGSHETSLCTVGAESSSFKCVNCVSNKLGNAEHRAFDASKCPLIKRRLTEKAKNISY